MAACSAKGACKVCRILILIGALNLGLIGLGNLLGFSGDVVYALLGSWPIVIDVLYVLIGLCAVMKLVNMCKSCK